MLFRESKHSHIVQVLDKLFRPPHIEKLQELQRVPDNGKFKFGGKTYRKIRVERHF